MIHAHRQDAVEVQTMNTDIFEGQWRQMRGQLRSWWGRLSDDDIENIAGQKDKLVGLLQEKYGYTREQARHEVDRRLQEYNQPTGQAIQSAPREEASNRGSMAGAAMGKAREAAAGAATKVSQATSAVREKLGSVAGAIREKVPQEGAVRTATTTMANKLGAAGSYLQERDLDQLGGELSNLIRRYPIPALLIGLGIGYLWGRGRGGQAR
jgi:uncharacterized protein YjbJ (UPF0337 family)